MNFDWSDTHDYLNEIDEGYISSDEFCLYNKILPHFKDTHTSDEIFSMTMSELDDQVFSRNYLLRNKMVYRGGFYSYSDTILTLEKWHP